MFGRRSLSGALSPESTGMLTWKDYSTKRYLVASWRKKANPAPVVNTETAPGRHRSAERTAAGARLSAGAEEGSLVDVKVRLPAAGRGRRVGICQITGGGVSSGRILLFFS